MARHLPSVRDRLWLIAHDDRYELRPWIDVRALNIGLITATLADLLVQDRIHVQQGRIYVHHQNNSPVGDPIAADILDAIAAEHTPRLTELIRDARADLLDEGHNPYQRLYERTLAALVAAGHLLEHRRRLRSNRYSLSEDDLISAVRAEVNYRLVYPSRRGDASVDCLCALVLALNLHHMVALPLDAGEAERVLTDITTGIPQRAGRHSPLTVVPHLVQVVRHAVGDLATSAF